MLTYGAAFKRTTNYYMALVKRNIYRSDLVDIEFAQLQQVCAWLSNHNDAQFLQLLMDLSPYLQTRSLYGVLLNYCQAGLRITRILNTNPGRLLILTSEAYFSLGEWDKALSNIQQAIALTETDDLPTHAQAILTLGRLQVNKGEYRSALQTLKTAEDLFTALSDVEGVAAAKAEVAAYLLVRGDYQQALKRYLEVNDMRENLERKGLANKTSFMLGVVYRRLKRYSDALYYLDQFLNNAKTQNDRNAIATALHHLAWVYYDQRKLAEAKQLGMQAKTIYQEIEDPRGASDADEQLGLIAFHEQDFKAASIYLEQALSNRLGLGNQPGAASTMHRLARVYLRKGDIVAGLRYLLRSLLLYYRINVLTRQRIIRMFRTPFGDSI